MPRTPENGAWMVLRSIVARISLSLASACFSEAAARVVLGARDRVLLDQPLHPLVVEARELELRFRASQLRLLLPRVELHQDVTLLDGLARVERDPIDDAGQIGTDRDALNRRNRPDRVECVRPALLRPRRSSSRRRAAAASQRTAPPCLESA